MHRLTASIALLGILAFSHPALADTYSIDRDHTTVGFKIRHLFSKVDGRFNAFEGVIQYAPGQPQAWSVHATIDAASIDTNVTARDKHLRSKDFFDVEQYPSIIFQSTGVTEATDAGAKLSGLLNIHGVEKPVELQLEVHGVGKDPWGNVRSGFTATTTINRKDFGLGWNETLETGQLLVGEEVMITIEVEGVLADKQDS
jgi:polyisoprenoid-binding protein YceI